MFRIFDTITGDVLDYEDVDEFCEVSKFAFDDSVHDAIDEMCGAYKRNECLDAYEQYLGIKVVSDMSLDVFDLVRLHC